MRLHDESLTEKEMPGAMKLLFGVTEILGADTELLRPLHQLPLQGRLDILESLPTFNARGLEGESGADAAPVVEDDDDVAKYLADSEVEEEETEAVTASASAEEASSPRAERVEAVVEVSSGGEEFLVAPSRRITEGGEEKEEEDQAAGPGAERREGRSKKKHDKPAGCPAGTPLKRKAETAPSGAGSGGIASRLRRSVQWVDSTAPRSG